MIPSHCTPEQLRNFDSISLAIASVTLRVTDDTSILCITIRTRLWIGLVGGHDYQFTFDPWHYLIVAEDPRKVTTYLNGEYSDDYIVIRRDYLIT